jgi:hypothetical protein
VWEKVNNVSNIIRIVADAVNARAIGVSPALGQDLYNLMSFDVEGAEFSTAYSRGWNGRSSFYSARSGSFPRGFLPTVVDRLRRLGVQVQLNVIRPPAPLGPSIEQCVAESGYDPDPRYAYQATAVKSLMSYTQCIAQLSTGGGKSQVARIAHRHIGRTTLFLTTRSVLLEQMREGMEERGVPVGTLGNGV